MGTLFSLCKKSNKSLFAAGCGMAMLVYYCATNYSPLHVINGQGKGSSLDEIQKLSELQLRALQPNDAFLDNVTGDYYLYKSVRGEETVGRERASGYRRGIRDCTSHTPQKGTAVRASTF